MHDQRQCQRQAADRLFRHARREMFLVLFVTALALLWTVGYCYLFGYQHDSESWVVEAGWVSPRSPDDFQQIAGIPDWVFVGILLPWLVCTAFSIGVCLGLKDDDLGAEAGEPGASGVAQPATGGPHGH